MQNFFVLEAPPFDPRASGSSTPDPQNSRQRGRMGKGVVFTTTLIEWSGFNPHPGHVVVSLDKTLYDDYLCSVASNKQQIQWTRIRKNPQEHIGSSETPKQVRIPPTTK